MLDSQLKRNHVITDNLLKCEEDHYMKLHQTHRIYLHNIPKLTILPLPRFNFTLTLTLPKKINSEMNIISLHIYSVFSSYNLRISWKVLASYHILGLNYTNFSPTNKRRVIISALSRNKYIHHPSKKRVIFMLRNVINLVDFFLGLYRVYSVLRQKKV